MQRIFSLGLLVLTHQLYAAGVTLITHGFQFADNYPAWVDEMGAAVASRAGHDTAIVKMEIRRDGGRLVVSTFQLQQGTWPSEGSTSGEIVVKLFWHTVAGLTDPYSTDEIAATAAPFFVVPIKIDRITIPPLSELPLHLIGHSRGGSLICELAYVLGESRIWVNHVTTLDPHPLGFGDLTFTTDPPIVVADNVLFLDNYYQTSDFPDGQAIQGATQINLGERGPIGHSDVHAWYLRTITNRNDFVPAFWLRTNDIGFQFSSIATGTLLRYSTNSAYSGSGLSWNGAARSVINSTNSTQWPNIDVQPWSERFFVMGQNIGVKTRTQINTTNSVVVLGTDIDRNPYNQVFTNAVLAVITGTNRVAGIPVQQQTTAATADLDARWLYAAILDSNGNGRFHYGDRPLSIRRQEFLGIELLPDSVVFMLRTNGRVLFSLQASHDLQNWFSLGATSNAVFGVRLADLVGTPRIFFRTYLESQ